VRFSDGEFKQVEQGLQFQDLDLLHCEVVRFAATAVIGLLLCACGTIEPISDDGGVGGIEICDAVDNDQDGYIDEGVADCCAPGDQRTCGPESVGACQAGTTTCDTEGAWRECSGAIEPTEELCDDIDNDCDHFIDEGVAGCCQPDALRACGPSQGICEPGTQVCGGDGSWGDCTGGVLPETEVCDGLDNNCDGTADEIFDLDGDGAVNKFIPECFANAASLTLDCDDTSMQIQSGCKYYVTNPGQGAQSGKSWANARGDLASLLAVSVPGETYWVKAGTYSPSSSDAKASFLLTDGVSVLGGFDGVANDGTRDPVANETILSGGNFNYHVVTATGAGLLDGFSVTGGKANVTSATNKNGGGILITGAAEIRNCRIHDNVAWSGGGVSIENAAPLLVETTIDHNTANTIGQGGGIYGNNSHGRVERCEIRNNNSVGVGGGIYDTNGGVTVTSSLIVENENGGAYLVGSNAAFINVTAVSNYTHPDITVAAGTASMVGVYNSIVAGGVDDVVGNTDVQNVCTTNYKLGSNYRPLAGSCAINAGSNAYVLPDMLLDLAGTNRIKGGTVDLGAFEL